jgi:phosphoserine aminotransferase
MVPASDTGAVEMMLWQLLGPRGVTVGHWESFGSGWFVDVEKQLKLKVTFYLACFPRRIMAIPFASF